MNFRCLSAGVVALCVLLLPACATYEQFKDAYFREATEPEATVRIGVFQPLSGKEREFGELERIGIELAHELYPTALGKTVELIFADHESDMQIAESVIQDLIEKRPAIVLGSYGDVYSLIAAPFLEAEKIPAIAITNTNPLVTSNNPYYFRICYVDSFEGVAVAKYAAEGMGVTTAAILKPREDDFAVAVSQEFRNKMIQLTVNPNAIVSSQDYSARETDFTRYLSAIQNAGAQVVFLPAHVDDAAEIFKQAEALRVRTVFLGTGAWDTPELLEEAGETAAEGVAFSTVFDPESGITEMANVFLEKYREKYGEDQLPPSAVAHAFDAYCVAIDALNRAGTALDGDAIVRALSQTHEYPGASGSITFDAKGDPIKSVVIKAVRDGEVVSVYTVEPTWVVLPGAGLPEGMPPDATLPDGAEP